MVEKRERDGSVGRKTNSCFFFSFFLFLFLNLPGSEATWRGRRAWRARELSVGERDY